MRIFLPVKLLTLFILTLCMLLSFCFGIGTQFVPVYVPFIIFTVVVFFLIKPVKFTNSIIMLYKRTPFKYLVWFSAWALFTIIINAFWGRFFIGGFINSTIGGLFASVLLPIIFINFVCPRYVSVKYLIKFFYFFCWIIFMIAIIEFIAYYFDIPVIKDIISIFSNKRGFVEGSDVYSRFFVGAFPRSRSVFEEPAGLGYFILMTSSIIYELNYCKIKIFDNIIIEKLLKKSIIITMWVALILTQSPIFLIFNLLLIFYYYLIYKHNIHKLIKIFKKHIIQILVLFFLIIFCIVLLNMFYKIDVSEIYINRIVNVVTSVKIIDDFIAVEPSLATRFITCLNIYLLGIKHSFTGVGYGNMTYLMPLQFQQSPLPLTPELVLRMLNETPGNSMIAAKVFSETGIIGFILFYTFIIKLYKYVKKIISKFVNVENHFLQGVLLFIIVFVLSSLYSSNMNNPYVWIIMGISLCAIKIMIRRKDNI